MSDPIQNSIERTLAEMRAAQEEMARVQQELADVSVTSTAKGRVLAVTVDSRGDVTGIAFPTSAYRSMAPTELGALLVDTIRTARAEASQVAVEAFSPLLPSGFPLAEMMSGAPDLDAMMQEAMQTATVPFPGEPGWNAGTGPRRTPEA